MRKRFLITGASGFVGASLTRRLVADGEEVHILTRKLSDKWRIADILDEVVEHEVDILEAVRLEKILLGIRPEVIYHCAAYGAVPGQHDPIKLAQANLVGTVNLVQAVAGVDYECLVNTGSSAEYGLKAKPMSESAPLEPVIAYGATKAAATLFCQAVARNSQQPIMTLRLFSPYGPFDAPHRLIPTVIRRCLDGEDVALSSGTEARDFFFVEDLVDLYLQIPSSRWSPGEVVNAGSGHQHTVRDVATKVIELTGADVDPLWGEFPERDFDTDTWVADVTKARVLLGWTPKVGFDEGLRRTIEWQRTRMATAHE